MIIKIIFLLGLIAISALFSASETALLSLSQAKVLSLVSKKVRGAKIVERIKSNPHRLLVTVLIGNNFVNIGASVYAGAVFTDAFGSKGLGIATGVMTLFILIFAEITPKSFATKYATTFSLILSPLLLIIQYVLSPIIWIFEGLVKISMKIFQTKYKTHSVTEDEIIAMASIGAAEGSIDRQEKELIENILEFNDIEVREIMTSRTEIEALPDDLTVSEAAKQMMNYTHSRIPVYHKNLDNITAIISVKDIFHFLHSPELLNKKLKNLDLARAYEVPNSKKINALFHEFKRKRSHIAVVVDEHGGTEGIVTMEDILEEIVGEIADEFDREDNLMSMIGKNTLVAKGKTPVYEIEETLKVEIGNNPEEDYKPISSLILDELHRFPHEGEVIDFKEVKIKIEKMSKKKIERVKVFKITGDKKSDYE